jgi:hypothetical protein
MLSSILCSSPEVTSIPDPKEHPLNKALAPLGPQLALRDSYSYFPICRRSFCNTISGHDLFIVISGFVTALVRKSRDALKSNHAKATILLQESPSLNFATSTFRNTSSQEVHISPNQHSRWPEDQRDAIATARTRSVQEKRAAASRLPSATSPLKPY